MHKGLQRLAAGGTLAFVLLGAIGCMAFQAPEERSRPTASRPIWDLESMIEHLEFLGSTDAEQPETSTSEHEERVQYAAARMREYMLQPILKDTYELAHLPLAGSRSSAEGPTARAVAGYVAGKHPEHAQELVIVCAELEAAGERNSSGGGAAALLEVARNYSLMARYGLVPERSVLFVLLATPRSGSDDGRVFLPAPLWALEAAQALIYVGLPSKDQSAVKEAVSAYGLRFYAVAPEAFDGIASDSASSERSPIRQVALQQVWPMARETHELLRMEVLSGGPLFPLPDDSLSAPLER